ncbi:hypothetical protein K438DRAFT_1815267 [Mycena galopus ATCC 62051]|nr:hypothetical protein K438DRAFT_1815267 [Mycena galopus ATCC 62051]
MSSKRVVKTLYTAKFYESPSSSESTRPSPPQPSVYLEQLFHAHVSLNQMKEVPPSPPHDEAQTERVEALRQKVVDAYNAANGNPASGKWGLLANLLRTGTGKGKYRYINTRTDAVPPEQPPEGWLLAETEEEWNAWEKKRKRRNQHPVLDKKQLEEQAKDRLLMEKVESWKRHISSDDPEIPGSSPMPDEVPESSPMPIKSKKSFLSSDAPKTLSKNATTSSRAPNSRTRVVSEVQEPLFPPSFPANLPTSTPLLRSKPSPIELVPSSSPILSPPKRRGDLPRPSKPSTSKISPAEEDVPSSSPLSSPPKVSRVYGRGGPSQSQLKRARSSSPTPHTTTKKIRAAPSAPVSGSAPAASPPFKAVYKTPVTPPRNALPKLEDLIAASAQKQKSKAKAKEREKGKAKVQPAQKSNPSSKSPEDTRSTSQSSEERRRHRELEAGISVVGNAVINWDETLEKMTANHVGAGDVSPTKSLSSIADSNSLESPQNSGMDLPNFSSGAPFEPMGASTQPMGMLGEESLGTTERGERAFGQPNDFGYPMRYESQMDVESNMQGVEELLDADVGGYTGPWMRAGSDGDEDAQWDGRNIDSSP